MTSSDPLLLGFVSDVHIGNHHKLGGILQAGINRRCRETVDALRLAYHWFSAEAAGKEGAFFIVGDLFNSARPSPQQIAAVQHALDSRLFRVEKRKIRNILVRGNHDMISDVSTDNALAPFWETAAIIDTPWSSMRMHSDSTGSVHIIMIPYSPGRAMDWLPTYIAEVVGNEDQLGTRPTRRVLVIHLGIQDSGTAAYMRGHPDAVTIDLLVELACTHNIDAIFAGNWHDPKVWEYINPETQKPILIVQCGALVPTGWNNPGSDYGILSIYDPSKEGIAALDRKRIPGPRFHVVHSAKEVEDLLTNDQENVLYLRWDTVPENERNAIIYLQDRNEMLNFEWEVKTIKDTAKAEQAVAAARGMATVDEAIDHWIQTRKHPAGISPEEIKERIQGFMNAIGDQEEI